MVRKINIKKDRKEIARIIEINLPLMNKNKLMCQDIADVILSYLLGLIGEKGKDIKNKQGVKKL